ncbi:hypothetical protein C8R43DRAFT_1139990 [Mycena crocata]|nr:hypothetical protein C8R43DRAFT_1139990 [Mycena crocata]
MPRNTNWNSQRSALPPANERTPACSQSSRLDGDVEHGHHLVATSCAISVQLQAALLSPPSNIDAAHPSRARVENNVNPWKSDSDSDVDTGEDTDDNADPLTIDDPLNRIGSQVSRGRPAATSPLHPGRKSSKGGKGKKSNPSDDEDSKRSGPIKFSNAPGPKAGHPNSLLPGQSPQKKAADKEEKERLAEERRQRKEAEKALKAAEREDKKRRREEKKIGKNRERNLAEREPEDRAYESHMLSGLGALEFWEDKAYRMRVDDGQGFADLAVALSACMGAGILVLPTYLTQLAKKLHTFDWKVPAQTIIDQATAAAEDDPQKANGPFSDGSQFHHLNYYSKQIEASTIMFLYRDEDVDGREHWLLFRHSVKQLDCIDPLETHQEIRTSTRVVAEMNTIASYLLGEDAPNPSIKGYQVQCLGVQKDGTSCSFWAAALCILQIASRPPWISRAEDSVANKAEKQEASVQDDCSKMEMYEKDSLVQSSDVNLWASSTNEGPWLTEIDKLELMKAAAREKLEDHTAPIFVSHLRRMSSLEGWFNGDVINEWAEILNELSPTTRVKQIGFFNSLRKNIKQHATDKKSRDIWWKQWIRGTCKWFKINETRAIILPIHVPAHWICAFVDFDNNYIAVFDSWKRNPVPNNDWKRSEHAEIFEMIREWLQRLFLSLKSVIDWEEWKMDPCPKV